MIGRVAEMSGCDPLVRLPLLPLATPCLPAVHLQSRSRRCRRRRQACGSLPSHPSQFHLELSSPVHSLESATNRFTFFTHDPFTRHQTRPSFSASDSSNAITMKLSIALLTAAAAVSAAQPHQHRHQHLHKQRRDAEPDMVVVAGPTMIAYVLNGTPIPGDEVTKGIADGTLILANDGQLAAADDAPASSASETAKADVAPSSSSSVVAAVPTPSSISAVASSAPAAVSSSSSSSAVEAAPSPSASSHVDKSTQHTASSGSSSSGSSGTGVNTPFPDGEIDCSTFPSEYGAVAVDYIGLGGWTGVQQAGAGSSLLSGLTDIMTVVSGQCSNGDCCSEGAYCSYACPAGYQKSQWPTTQGSTGQSVGGILCQNGKLKLTNPSMSNTLCMTGTDKVTVLVKNTLGEDVAVCRTDYPGTESETVPLDAKAGSTTNLTCPDADNYYNWEGGHTSAQYYVNPSGVSIADGCTWGSSANPWGNFAPLNLGVGYSAGSAWLAIFQNAPTTDAKLDFTVEIQGDDMSGTCKYSNGQYCSGEGYTSCSSTTGCTVYHSLPH